MKKLISVLTLFALVLFNTQIIQAAPTTNISSTTIKKYDLQTVQSTPSNITPLKVANEDELKKLLNELDKAYKAAPTATPKYSLDSTRIINNKTVTHVETIFDLSSVGGKIISNLNYTYSYWVAPESYKTQINYQDVTETGIYGFQSITIFSKSATTNGPTITGNVRGQSQVYIGIGGNASGNLVLATFPFNKTYTIQTGN